jgi:cystathionine beta-lyase family protein involved in aluminum resistance
LDKEKLWQSIKPSISAKTKMICFQRSMGYSSTRPSVAVDSINFLIDKVKQVNPQIICFVDNCYGEFVEITEPKADLMAGSLIKNPGGGIAVAGGYLAGKTKLIAKAADRLTAPGIGADGGVNFDEGRILFQGLYQAPLAVNQMLKSSLLLARCFAELGYKCWPAWNEVQIRTDTILRVDLGQKEKMLQLCGFVQSNSPVNSHLTPIPDQTPGYQDEVIMAAGTFVEGSTSELSVDGPIREPYSAFIQGGLSCFYTKILVTKLLESSW